MSTFKLIDFAFSIIALFTNPYRTCRKFLQKRKAENIHAYGETPYATYQRIITECNIGPQDTWLELGSGRGKGCFWLAHHAKCNVIGVEWIPQFVHLANFLKRLFRTKNLEFIQGDIEKADLSKATVIYLYGLWPNITIPANVKVITTSEPLPGLTVLKQFWVRYPWGRTAAYLQVSHGWTGSTDGQDVFKNFFSRAIE
jgi:hypothetical protein